MIFMWDVSISSWFFQSDSTLFLLNIIKIIKERSCDQLFVRKCGRGENEGNTTTPLVDFFAKLVKITDFKVKGEVRVLWD